MLRAHAYCNAIRESGSSVIVEWDRFAANEHSERVGLKAETTNLVLRLYTSRRKLKCGELETLMAIGEHLSR